MLNPLYRRTAVAVTMLVTGVTTTRLRAQTTAIGRSPTQIHGVRQQRARYVTSQFFNLWASATSDGEGRRYAANPAQ